jgi:hypothetical protein
VTVKSVNLIPAPRRDAKRRRRHRNACLAVCGAYASLLAGAVGVAHVALTGTGRTLDQQLASAESEVQRIEQAAAHSRRELASARATIEANRTVAEQPDWSVLLALLAKTTSDDVILRGVTIGPPVMSAAQASATPRGAKAAAPDAVLEIMGVGRTQLAVSRHVLRMEQTGLFSKVTLVDTGRETFLRETAIGFRLQCTFGEPGQTQATQLRSTGAVTSVAEPAAVGGITR